MERPDDPALDALIASVEQLRRMEIRAAELKARIANDAQALSGIEDRRQRIVAGAYAYWLLPEVHASDIALGVTGKSQPGKLRSLIGEVSAGIACDRCQDDLSIASRQAMKEALDRLNSAGPRWPEGFRVLCGACEIAIHEARRAAHDADMAAWERRRLVLQTLPYSDYLATPDWTGIRAEYVRTVVWATQTIECETCSSEVDLGLYHHDEDALAPNAGLVILCTGCRDALLARGKLHSQSGDANLLLPGECRDILEANRAERFG